MNLSIDLAKESYNLYKATGIIGDGMPVGEGCIRR